MLETKSAKEYYWATETNPDELIAHLQSRALRMKEAYQSSNIIDRIIRNWRYYYNLYFQGNASIGDHETAILGEAGEKIGVASSHFRSLIRNMVSIVTGGRPTVDSIAVNTDPESLHQCRVSNKLCEYYLKSGLEAKLKRAAEQAFVMTMGFCAYRWESDLGDEQYGIPEAGEVVRSGDIHSFNPTIFDVVWNPTTTEWTSIQWVMVREPVNRWDLMAKYPDIAESLKGMKEMPDQEWCFDVWRPDDDDDDTVWKWCFYHLPTPAVPYGVEFSFVDDMPIYGPTPLRYRTLPVKAYIPAEMIRTCFGYSTAFDLQALQEAYNGELSSILSNHHNLGNPRIWVDDASDVTYKALTTDFGVVQSSTKPEPLMLAADNPGAVNMLQALRQDMEYQSHINSVSRGQPEASLRSGTSLALIDAKAVQGNEPETDRYHSFGEEVLLGHIQCLQDFPDESVQRTYSILGRNNRAQVAAFYKKDIERIQRVMLYPANPLARILSGRIAIAELLADHQLIKTPEEMLTVIETGSTEAASEGVNNQLMLARQENDAILDGMEIRGALNLDDHVLHLREHAKIGADIQARNDTQMMTNLAAHMAHHTQLLIADPGTQILQMLLGYQMGAMPMPAGQAGSGQAPPSKPGEPKVPEADPSKNNADAQGAMPALPGNSLVQ